MLFDLKAQVSPGLVSPSSAQHLKIFPQDFQHRSRYTMHASILLAILDGREGECDDDEAVAAIRRSVLSVNTHIIVHFFEGIILVTFF